MVSIVSVLLVVWALVATQGVRVKTGPESLIGRTGLASSELAPEGTVIIDREAWTATTEGEPIHAGEKVEVLGVDGVVLAVAKPQPARTQRAHVQEQP